MTDTDTQYLSRADLYRWANDPYSVLTEHVIVSARLRIIQQDPEHWDEELDNQVCDNWCVALRTVLGEAWEAVQMQERARGAVSSEYAAELWGRRYLGALIIRRMIQEMFRQDVPADERLM